MELRAWRIIVPLPRPLQFILTILKKKELQHLFHQFFTNFPNTEGICNAVACESHQRTRPLLAILNFSMWSTSVFTTEKKTEPAESEALKLLELGQHQVGFHAAAMDDGLADPDAATAKRASGIKLQPVGCAAHHV